MRNAMLDPAPPQKKPSPPVITQKAPRRLHLKEEARKDTLGTQPPVNK